VDYDDGEAFDSPEDAARARTLARNVRVWRLQRGHAARRARLGTPRRLDL